MAVDDKWQLQKKSSRLGRNTSQYLEATWVHTSTFQSDRVFSISELRFTFIAWGTSLWSHKPIHKTSTSGWSCLLKTTTKRFIYLSIQYDTTVTLQKIWEPAHCFLLKTPTHVHHNDFRNSCSARFKKVKQAVSEINSEISLSYFFFWGGGGEGSVWCFVVFFYSILITAVTATTKTLQITHLV